MSKLLEKSEEKKTKIDSLISGFSKAGFDVESKINQDEIKKYLDSHSSSGKFEQVLSYKLIQVLSLDKEDSISIEDFISGFLQFEEDIKNNSEDLKKKLIEENEIYKKLLEEKPENSEKNEDAKVFGEITDIDIRRKLKGIKEIIIKVVFNDKNKEFHFKLGDKDNSDIEFKKFEFKPTSRNDHFEFIMQGITNKDKIFEIGKKVFPLNDVKSSEEYLVQIEVPENEEETKVAAYINAKIILYWNDMNYEQRKKMQKIKIKKLNIAIKNAEEYLRNLREIYSDKKKKQKKRNYIVEFNNTKEVLLKVEFNNEKNIPQKVEENKEIKQEEIKVEENLVNINTNNDNNNANQINEEYNEINIDDYINSNNANNNINYEEYQTTTNTNVTEEIIRKSINKEIATRSILPPIYKEKINQVIYDKDVKTLPLIYGETKVTYSNNNNNNEIYTNTENNNYNYTDNNNYTENNYTDNNYNYTENNNNYIESNYNFTDNNYTESNNNYIDNNNYNYTDNYNDVNNLVQGNTYEIKETQVITRRLGPEEYPEYNQEQVVNYTDTNQMQSYNQEINVQNYSSGNNINYGLLQPLYGENSYEEYKKTSY